MPREPRAARTRPIEQPAPPVPLLSDYLTIIELAAQLGRTPTTLYRWHVRDIGPPRVRLGRKVLYKRAAVIEWLESQAGA